MTDSSEDQSITISVAELRRALEGTPGDHLLYLAATVLLLFAKLKETAAPSELAEPLSEIHSAILDVVGGKSHPIFTPQKQLKGGAPPLSVDYASNMDTAAAAITLAPRGEKEETTRQAARKLSVSTNTLKYFRKNLMKGRQGPIKNGVAHVHYEFYIRHFPNVLRMNESPPLKADDLIKLIKSVSK